MEDDNEDIPLHLKRPFGAGLKLKRVEFVRASSPDGSNSAFTGAHDKKSAESVADAYLTIVIPTSRRDTEEADPSARAGNEPPSKEPICTICSLPIAAARGDNATGARQLCTSTLKTHEASIAHQVCLEHSHPPSHLDRKRMGLAHLESYGWDPDARLGLGPSGREGIHIPLKVWEKGDLLGVGAKVPDKNEVEARKRATLEERGKKGKTMGRRERKEKQRRERARDGDLNRNFYGNTDVDKYLGGGKPVWE